MRPEDRINEIQALTGLLVALSNQPNSNKALLEATIERLTMLVKNSKKE